MHILTTCKGLKQEVEIADQPFTVLVAAQGIKIEAPEHFVISAVTIRTMWEDMSEAAWIFITTGPLFKHFYMELFGEDAYIPKTKAEFLEELDEGTIHGAGVIIMLVEAIFENRPKIFLSHPDRGLHPQQQVRFMSVIKGILEGLGGHKKPFTTP